MNSRFDLYAVIFIIGLFLLAVSSHYFIQTFPDSLFIAGPVPLKNCPIVKAGEKPDLDSDRDGLPDCWEINFLGSIRAYDGTDDPDNDQLINSGEYTTGTHPLKADTDGDSFNDGTDGYPLLATRWLQIPTWCAHVTVDKNQGLIADGQPFFPVGFWGFYRDINGGWGEYASHFSAFVDGLSDFHTNASKNYQLKYFLQLSGHGELVNTVESNTEIFALEPIHEPNLHLTVEEFRRLATQVRADDDCQRPVMVTPTSGAIGNGYLAQVKDVVDIGVAQGGYGVPQLAIDGAGKLVTRALADMGPKPVMLVTSIPGYQPSRYRYAVREKLAGEVRVQAFDAILSGAKGVFFWDFSAGSSDTNGYGFQERSDSSYNVEDSYSSQYYAGLKRLGEELKQFTYVFTSPVSTMVKANWEAKGLRCAVWDVTEQGRTNPYLICANLAQEPSPWFEGVSGNTVWRTDSRVLTTDGKVFPEYTCRDGKDNDDDGLIDYPADSDCAQAEDDEFSDSNPYRYRNNPLNPDLVSMQEIYTGVSNQDRRADKVRIYFAGAPQGATFTYAIYADSLRDNSPNRRIFVSDSTPIPTAPGEYTFPVTGVTLEHTRKYYLLVKASTSGVLIHEKDARYGVRIRDSNPNDNYYTPIRGPITFTETYPELYKGLSNNTVTIKLSGGPFPSYCVWKNQEQNCVTQSFNGYSFQETFAPYAVHIYRLNK